MIDKNVPKKELQEAFAFARKVGATQSLVGMLHYLHNYAGRETTRCQLYKDFAPFSFGFTMFKNGERWFNGGLIYFGPGETGVGLPQLSVRLNPSNGHEWSIHT